LCTLLKHPRSCPHGLTIPSGKCCKNKQEKEEMEDVIPNKKSVINY
jgi:Mn-dependent DtxR family transcriptional regulator